MTCDHPTFDWKVGCNRLRDSEPPRYIADLTIKCGVCGLPFRFKGLPVGLLVDGASVSSLGLEARLAIEPLPDVAPPPGKVKLSIVN